MSKSDLIKIDFRGLPELKELLEELPKRSIKKGFRRALNLAATPILRAMKAGARKAGRTGLLAKSLKKKLKTFPDGTVICLIGPDRNVSETHTNAKGKSVRHRPAFISHLIEKGHQGPHPAPAYPFIKPAFDSNQGTAADKAKEILIETLESEAAKLGRKE